LHHRLPLSSTLFPYTTLFRSMRVAHRRFWHLAATTALPMVVFTVPVAIPSQDAQSQTTRTLKIVVPYPAGGPADVLARILGEKRSEEHTSELQSRFDLVCRLL